MLINLKIGQGIPPGLHVRIDMQTGKKEAKLLDDAPLSSSSALISTEKETEDKEEPVKNQDTKWDEAEIKEALKKMKNDANKNEESSNNFRSYEEIKEEMKKLETSIKTEYEIVKDLVVKYTSLQQEDSEVRLSTLEDLEYYLHQYDNANDFVNMGGLKTVVLPALNSTDNRLRSAAAFLLGITNKKFIFRNYAYLLKI
jgi:nucleotide exchange factor SIL1